MIIDLGNGAYAMLGHLKRRSITVDVGDRVTAGEQVAQCGYSGNSTEPHLHFQLMDHRNVIVAGGVPFTFADPDGQRIDIPPNGSRLATKSAVSHA